MKVVVRDAPGLNLNGESKDQLNKLREVFRQASFRVNGHGGGVGGAAEVVLELHQQQNVVELRLNGVRVMPDELLLSGIKTIMHQHPGRTATCELLGAPKVNRRAALLRHGEVRSEGNLQFAMHDDAGQSIDRY